MKINFVTEPESKRWVLRYWADSLARQIPRATVSTKASAVVTWNIFVNYALYRQVPTKTAAVFTHREFRGPLRSTFERVAQQVDWCFAQCQHTAVLLPRRKVSILRMYPQPEFYGRDIVLGVVGRPYKSGRKRFSWVSDLERIRGVRIVQAKGAIPLKEMPAFYASLDYLVVLAENEGGPMTVLEALARGVPVIAPDVGWCWEFPVLRYKSKEGLLRLVQQLVVPADGWKRSAQEILRVLRSFG